VREKNREKRKVDKKLKSVDWERKEKKRERERERERERKKLFEPDNVSILNFFKTL